MNATAAQVRRGSSTRISNRKQAIESWACAVRQMGSMEPLILSLTTTVAQDVRGLVFATQFAPAALLEKSRPDILFFQAGVDPLEHDLLGRLMLSLDGLRARDGIIARAARQCGVPLVLTLGGGYARPISLSVDAHVATWRESRDVFGR